MQTIDPHSAKVFMIYNVESILPRVPVVFWGAIEDMDRYDEFRYTAINQKIIMTIKRIK